MDRRALLALVLVVTALVPVAGAGLAAPESAAGAAHPARSGSPVAAMNTGETGATASGLGRRDRPPPLATHQPGTADCRARNGSVSDATIRSVYPNPAANEDRGEHVVVRFPDGSDLGQWTLTDGEHDASLPNRTVSGAVVLAAEPSFATNLTGRPFVRVDAGFALANGGETVTLRRCDERVDSTTYADAPEAERWTDGSWRPLGATEFSPVVVENATVEAFALPDAPDVPIRTLRSADERLLLGGYTFASERAAVALQEAAARGVETRVLLDGSPVGGLTRREAALLDRLVAAGVEVRVLDGPLARYEFHHPKYAVADDRALVASENWKPSGTGGNSSRGWGVVVRNADLADGLAAVFREDAAWRAAIPWQELRPTETVESGPVANASYQRRFDPGTFRADRVRLLVAPENAEAGVVDLLESANSSIAVEQVSIEAGSRFLRATVDAARRGVDVRVLLSAAWYVEGDNQRLVDRLNRIAAREDLPLEARLVDPGSRFEKIHVKGLVVDERRVVVGSLNWNNNSARENREVVVVLEDEAAGEYYAEVFEADWRGGIWRVTVGLGIAVVVAWMVALGAGRRVIRFEADDEGVGFGGSEVGVHPGHEDAAVGVGFENPDLGIGYDDTEVGVGGDFESRDRDGGGNEGRR